ncbi:hypothetical protein GF339_02960 [candidate division KSB3 bacterium]|jgi:Icc-related predicted phosphoesterase|uniref:Calcineurin-like phosphoesterase domain-containing protein n=1 Tax=candidate division KSB3 bacterium TaxID=2044937 RepID=A0A9D5JSX2_9BACT|nr:hypothetical protein [candidate division KSB3 bacterium]MBD3323515.1 hypothetical protein [candidate division KSB3 bacterium]
MPARPCFFVSDLHGALPLYRTLFTRIAQEQPYAVFLGGDLLPSGLLSLSSARRIYHDFLAEVLYKEFAHLQQTLGDRYPHVFLILGNDDGRFEEADIAALARHGVWHYAHNQQFSLDEFQVFGYSYIPPTPFLLKDWERYDVSRFVDPGCISPEEGYYTVEVPDEEKRWATIQDDLAALTENNPMERAIFLFHSPPYQTHLDRAALDGQMIDAVPLDVHVGSIAIQNFITHSQPYLTLHGHIHESPRLTGSWQERIGRTRCFSAAHDGEELALVRFDLSHPEQATRMLL